MAKLNQPIDCEDCGARLSRYRTSREYQCAPCQQKRIDKSLKHAHAIIKNPTRPQKAFALRWRGYEWDAIQATLKYPTPIATASAARDYAKRKGLTLP